MNTYFLKLLDYHQKRRIRVIENILKSRRTVANLFWAQQYGILNWQGAYRELTRSAYDNALQELTKAGLIECDGEFARLTAAGVAYQEKHQDQEYKPHFFDWYWVANTNQLANLFMLGMQVSSEFAYRNHRYAPLAVPYRQMMSVKRWFYQERSPRLGQWVYADLDQLATALASEDERLATALAYTLIGHQVNSWTSDQLAKNLGLTLADGRVLSHDLLLALGAYCLHVNGPLQHLLQPQLLSDPLPASVRTSLILYQRTPDFAVVARKRRLKENTIREHLLEAAIVAPDRLNFEQLLPEVKRAQLAERYPGKDVLSWQFTSDQKDSGAAFFDFRLYQIYQGGLNRGR